MKLSAKITGILVLIGILFASCRKEVITQNPSDKELLENTIKSGVWKINAFESSVDNDFLYNYAIAFNEDGSIICSHSTGEVVGQWNSIFDDRTEELILNLEFSPLEEINVLSTSWVVVNKSPENIQISVLEQTGGLTSVSIFKSDY